MMAPMARIGIFRRDDFDPGAYAMAVFHAQLALAGPEQTRHRLSLHTFTRGTLPQVAQTAGVDGLLTFGPDGSDLDFLRRAPQPSVVCERVVEGCNYVAPDNYDIGRVAARHLLELGHTELAVAIPGRPESLGEYHGQRLRGFLETCSAAGYPVSDANVLFAGKDEAGGDEVAARLLDRAALPTALFMQNQSMMLGLLRAFRRCGVSIPEAVSIIGTSFRTLNAHEVADHTDPPLTAVTFAKDEMGSRGVRFLVDAVEGHARGPWQVLLPGILVRRMSTAPSLTPARV
jgi:LacI family transcriptional regulator